MAEPSDKTKNSVSKMSLGGIGKSLLGGAKKFGMWNLRHNTGNLFDKNSSSELVDKNHMPPAKVLGEIYKMLKIMEEDKKLNHEMANSHLESEEIKKDIRNKEIIKALTGRKAKKPVTPRKRKTKKEEEPTVPTGKTGKTPETGKTPDKNKAPDKGTNKADETKKSADAKKAEADKKSKSDADAKKAENDRIAQEKAAKREKEEQQKAAARQKQIDKEQKAAEEAKNLANRRAAEAVTEAEKKAAARAQEEANKKLADAAKKKLDESAAQAKSMAEKKIAEEAKAAAKKKAEEEAKATAKRLKDEEAKKTAERLKAEREAAARKSAEESKNTATKTETKPATTAPTPGSGPAIITGVVGMTVAEQVAARISKRESAGNSPDSFLLANYVASDKNNPKKPHDVKGSNKIEKGNIDVTTGKIFDKSLTDMSIGEVIELAERRAKYFGAGGAGSAMGKYQFIPITLRDRAPEALGKNWIKEPFSAANQEKLNTNLITYNAKKLKDANVPITDASLYMLHFFGNPWQAKMVLNGKDDDSMKDILDYYWNKKKPDNRAKQPPSVANPKVAALTVGEYKKKYLNQSFDFKPINYNDLGEKVHKDSVKGQDGKKELTGQQQNSPAVTNNTIVNQQNNSPAKNTETEDDRPAWYRKLFTTNKGN